ncbi:MAG TPA: large conductance mechanosensitive channel protein MscL [Bdellovibrionales bacterium]|nr:large conductance mechanosensitive channel protein MscL [Bdellovibrionales bacterium]
MSMMEEFKKFAVKGNVVDLAVGVIIGAAFGKIVTALVNQIIMPPIGLLIGNVNFSNLKVVLKPAMGEAAEVAIGYGAFIQEVVNFLIVAWAVFFMVRAMNRLNKKNEEAPAPAAPPAPPEDIVLLREIRDALKK